MARDRWVRRPASAALVCGWLGLVAAAGCAGSGDVERVRQEQAQAKAKMSAELQQERSLAASMAQESEAQKARAEKLALALGGAGGKTASKLGSSSCPSYSNALAVQVVNDSGLDDSQVYVLLTGTGIGWPVGGPPSGLAYLDIGVTPTGSQKANALTSMTPCGTITSAYTGKTQNIYQFGVSGISSGRLMVSYNSPVAVSNGNFPTGKETFRWDKMEFGYPGSGADLTSMDFFGIPMQFDYLGSQGQSFATMTYYTSTPTLLSALYNLNSGTMGNAFQAIGSSNLGTWTPSQPLSTFARVMGPSLLASNSTTGSPSPYPSFGSYLASVTGQTQPAFTVSGAGNAGCSNAVGYTYSASFASDGKKGYTVTLTSTSPMTNGPPCGITPPPGPQNVTLPANLPITVSLPAPSQKAGYDVNLYGAPATAFTVPTTSMNAQQKSAIPNSLYAVIAGDFLAGFNFGYAGNGSNATQNSANWYSNPPTLYPFASTRKSNDGYYNPYAAVLYNQSDAYGFAYSDRGGRPSPYVPLPSSPTTMRVTILNDNRLDAPLVTVSNPTTSSLTITWPASSGATGYSVAVSYGGGIPVTGVTLTPAAPSPAGTTISGLSPGTTYVIAVTATGANSIQSHAVPVYGTTSGTIPPLTGGSVPFGTGLNWSVGPSKTPTPGYRFAVNGSPYTPGGAPASIAGGPGQINVFGLTVTDSGSKTVYKGNYVVDLSALAPSSIPPHVAFGAPPSGTAAQGTATISGGAVTGVTITKGGSGYTAAPGVGFDQSQSGASAQATATVSGGSVTGATVTNGGSYTMFNINTAFLTPPISNVLTTGWEGGGGNTFPAGPIPNIRSLVIGTPFAPVPDKKAASVVFPTP